MAEVLMFHHALGRTAGVESFAAALRDAGHVVHVPDLYDGRTFDDLDAGIAHAAAIGFDEIIERGAEAARDVRGGVFYLGLSLGALPAQRLAQTSDGAGGLVLLHACVPTAEFGRWPAGLSAQIHAMDGDPIFVGDGDLDAARELTQTVDDAELFLYPGKAHLFTDSGLSSYDERATTLVRDRILDFLASR